MASPPQPPNALIQSAKIEKKRRTRRCSFDLRRGVLIHNAMKAHNQRKQERRKQREAAKVAQALEAIGGVKTSPSAVHCAETSPFLTPPPSPPSSPPLPNPLFGRLSENSPSSSSIPSSSNAKTSPTYLCADLLEMELELKHEEGDVIAKASANGVIVHACNCLGAWGSGIALQLKQHFPAAYTVYQQHCQAQQQNPAELSGTCLLIPPQTGDYEDDNRSGTETATTRSSAATAKQKIIKKEPVWIACLFTSIGYGKGNKRTGNPGVASKAAIEEATTNALLGMMWKWRDIRAEAVAEAYDEVVNDDEKDDDEDGKLREAEKRAEMGLRMPGSNIFSPRFNAGSFGVPWEATEELILQRWGGVEARWTVVSN